MSVLFCILSLVAVGAFADTATNGNSTSAIPVTVYYESLCPDSIQFIKNKLVPTYSQTNFSFSSLLTNLTLVPYGHANVSDAANYSFNCQHGPSECNGNKLHGCAIKNIPDKLILLNYIACLMNASTPADKSLPYPTPDTCSTVISSAILSEISDCYKSNEGWEIFMMNGNKTSTFFKGNFSVPYISFNNSLNDDLSTKARNDFRKTLCSEVGLNKDVCTDSPKSGAATLTASLTLIPAILLFFFAKP